MGFQSKVRHSFDAEPKVTLRDLTDGAETASANETGISLDTLDEAYWDNGVTPLQTAAVVFNITDLDTADGSEVYTLEVQVDSELAFGDSPVTIATLVPTAAGVYIVNLDGPTIDALDPDSTHIRVALTAAGVTPSITYGAWLAPAV